MASADLRNSPAIPQLLEGVGVNNGRRALEVAKTNATTRNKVIKLLLAIGVPAGLIAGVGSMMALNKSDGSLGNEKTGADLSALVINEPSYAGNVAALAADIKDEIAATTTLVSTTTPPSKVTAGTESLTEDGGNPEAKEASESLIVLMDMIRDSYKEAEAVKADMQGGKISEEDGKTKIQKVAQALQQKMAGHKFHDPTTYKLIATNEGAMSTSDVPKNMAAVTRLLDTVDGYPRSNAATKRLEGSNQIYMGNKLRYDTANITLQRDGKYQASTLHAISLKNYKYKDVVPNSYVAVFKTFDGDEARIVLGMLDSIDENLEMQSADAITLVSSGSEPEEE